MYAKEFDYLVERFVLGAVIIILIMAITALGLNFVLLIAVVFAFVFISTVIGFVVLEVKHAL